MSWTHRSLFPKNKTVQHVGILAHSPTQHQLNRELGPLSTYIYFSQCDVECMFIHFLSQGMVVPCIIGIGIYGICILPIHFDMQFLQVSSTFNDFTAHHMSKISCVPILSLKYHFWQ